MRHSLSFYFNSFLSKLPLKKNHQRRGETEQIKNKIDYIPWMNYLLLTLKRRRRKLCFAKVNLVELFLFPGRLISNHPFRRKNSSPNRWERSFAERISEKHSIKRPPEKHVFWPSSATTSLRQQVEQQKTSLSNFRCLHKGYFSEGNLYWEWRKKKQQWIYEK